MPGYEWQCYLLAWEERWMREGRRRLLSARLALCGPATVSFSGLPTTLFTATAVNSHSLYESVSKFWWLIVRLVLHTGVNSMMAKGLWVVLSAEHIMSLELKAIIFHPAFFLSSCHFSLLYLGLISVFILFLFLSLLCSQHVTVNGLQTLLPSTCPWLTLLSFCHISDVGMFPSNS